MRFLSVEIQNFMSYGEPAQTLRLEDLGLVSIVGINKDALGACSNGSGKSSIMEAIVWTLYGQTMRGYKGDEVVNRTNKENCFVRLALEENNSLYEIKRTRKVNQKRSNDLCLFIDGVDASQGTVADTQATIQTIIGMDFCTFTQSVMMWHGTQPFSKMTDKEQKEVLEDILQIDQLAKAKDIVKNKISKGQESLKNLTNRVLFLDATIEDLSLSISKLSSQDSQYAETIKQRRIALLTKKVDTELKINELYKNTGLDKLIKIRENISSKLEVIGNSRRHVQTEKLIVARSFAEKKAALSKREGVVQGRIIQLQEDIKAFNTLAGKVCPTCKQEFHVETASSCMDIWAKEAERLRSQEIGPIVNAQEALHGDEQSELSALAIEESRINQEIGTAQAELQSADDNVRKRKATLQVVCELEHQALGIQKELNQLDEEKNPYSGLIEESRKKRDDCEGERRSLTCKIDSLSFELSHLEYWNHGFGNSGLKSYILDNVVPFLTEKAQEYADIVSGGDIRLEFSTQTKLKSGEMKDSFQVKAVNLKGADVYHGNSDGERRRIDIAVGWALADLAATRAKKPIYFRGLDEPFEHLDTVGEDLVIKLLHKVLPRYETVMCVTHSAHLRDQFPKEVVVTFKNGFSKIS